MKKVFAIFAFVILALALSSCSFLSTTFEDDLEYKSDKSDYEAYFSALNIEVVSYLYEDDNGNRIEYEIQIGLRDLNGEPLLDEGMVQNVAGELSKELGLSLYYIDSFFIPDPTYGYSVLSAYTYYCFKIDDLIGASLIGDDPHYGFFYYGRDYTLIAPTWINSLRSDVYGIITKWLLNNVRSSNSTWRIYTIDSDAVRLRYYFGGTNLETEDAILVYKTIKSLEEGMLDCLMWEAGEIYDFTSLSLSIEKMAPGWYIIPILLGTVIVVILYLVCKSKKDNSDVFRQVTAEKIDTAGTVKIIDGQISIEEYGTYKTSMTENDNA